jgi:CubicO group peptidase (beta-lactamase class C family)
MNVLTRPVAVTLAMVVALGFGASGRVSVPTASPESVGLSTAGLQAYAQALQSLVDERRLAGVSTLVARRGKVAMMEAYGYRDVDARQPLGKDTIFRIASMTKPIAGVAMMMLYEQGKWTLDDPVAKHIPEFKDLKVAGPTGPLAQAHPMTMRELMSHTAGFDVSAAYGKQNIPDTTKPLQAMIDQLAVLPLAAQPGTDWRYGPSVNIQGYIVEKLSKQPLDEFLRTRIFEPLQMKDTGFWVEPSKQPRLALLYTYGDDSRVRLATEQREPLKRPVFLSGSGGLLSTLEDYWRFAQMLLNGGELDGTRLLKRETVALMRRNVLNEGVMVDLYGPKEEGIGFGLDFAIVMDPAKANTPRGRDTFYWGGAFGTWFWIDPTNDLIVVGMIQNVGGSLPTGKTPPLRSLSAKLVYAALTNSTAR